MSRNLILFLALISLSLAMKNKKTLTRLRKEDQANKEDNSTSVLDTLEDKIGKAKEKVKDYEGKDCTVFCWGDLSCVDYRCVPDAKVNSTAEEKWTPDGKKCNWLHACPSGEKCEEHRCVHDEEGDEGTSCFWSLSCDKNLTCKDHRCVYKSDEKSIPEVKYTPDGPLCDYIFHLCEKGYSCNEWRCLKDGTKQEYVAPAKKEEKKE